MLYNISEDGQYVYYELDPDKPTCFVLVGLPASGKTTWWNENGVIPHFDFGIVSTDMYIDEYASKTGSTYTDVFKDTIKEATKFMDSKAKHLFDNNKNVVWDQTNLRKAKRERILNIVPDHYTKIAYCFFPPDKENEWEDRLNNRPGKDIPIHIIQNMANSFEYPSVSEGFDAVWDNNKDGYIWLEKYD